MDFNQKSQAHLLCLLFIPKRPAFHGQRFCLDSLIYILTPISMKFCICFTFRNEDLTRGYWQPLEKHSNYLLGVEWLSDPAKLSLWFKVWILSARCQACAHVMGSFSLYSSLFYWQKLKIQVYFFIKIIATALFRNCIRNRNLTLKTYFEIICGNYHNQLISFLIPIYIQKYYDYFMYSIIC